MKTRLIAGLIVVAAVVVAIIAVSSSGDDGDSTPQGSGKAVKLSLWTQFAADPHKGFIEDLIKRFEKEHPNINVEHRALPAGEDRTAKRNGMISGHPPDMLDTESDADLFSYVDQGQIEDISDWFKDGKNRDRFVPNALDAVTRDGRQYAMPTTINTGTQIFYNKKLVEKHGIDPTTFKTWADFEAAFDKLKAQGVTPIAFGNKEGWNGPQWLFPFLARWVGAEKVNQLISRNCGYKWSDPDMVRAAQFFVDLRKKGYFSKGAASDDYAAAQAVFFSGKAPFFQTGSWFPAIAEANGPPGFELGQVLFPVITGGKGTLKDNVVAVLSSFAISKAGAKDPDKRKAALTFLDWMTQLPQQEFQAKEIGGISVTKGATNPETTDPLTLAMMREQVLPSTGTFGFLENSVPEAVGIGTLDPGSVAATSGQLDARGWMEKVEREAAKHKPLLKVEPKCA